MSGIDAEGRGKYQVFPDLPPEEYEGLKADIQRRGVLVPVVLDEHSNIIDGHQRVRICTELGIDNYPREACPGLTDQEKRSRARALNLRRRHLTQDEKRDAIADELRETTDRSDRQIAASLLVDHKTVGSVRRELEGRGEIPHVEATIDTRGRKQRRKPANGNKGTIREPEEDGPPSPAVNSPVNENGPPPAEGIPNGRTPPAADLSPPAAADQNSGDSQEKAEPKEAGRLGATAVPRAAELPMGANQKETQWCLLPAAMQFPSPEAAQHFARAWLAEGDRRQLQAELVSQVRRADWMVLAIDLVCREDFNASLALPRLSEDERRKCVSCFQGAKNKLKPHSREATGSETPSVNANPDPECSGTADPSEGSDA